MSEGQVVVVTGDTGGVGPAVVQAFLSAGAHMIGASRGTAAAIQHPRFLHLAADLTTASGAKSVIDRVVAVHGRVDVAVHVMGGFAGGDAVGNSSEDIWHQMMTMNATSAFHFFQAVLPVMPHGGRILAVGSKAGVSGAGQVAAYAASKAALHALVLSIAQEVRGRGITANVLAPSTIDTAANRAAMPQADTSGWVQPQEIASLLLWLASPAGQHVSGAIIPMG